ncbi:hypothetical protein [Aeromonas veronii]|uniref:hypothetical protein n=1 Tax=Aeromonas veronii TaxID=654 RepID=UPI001F0B51F0|nr:hypothetical protein [Aeromonas veronii]
MNLRVKLSHLLLQPLIRSFQCVDQFSQTCVGLPQLRVFASKGRILAFKLGDLRFKLLDKLALLDKLGLDAFLLGDVLPREFHLFVNLHIARSHPGFPACVVALLMALLIAFLQSFLDPCWRPW